MGSDAEAQTAIAALNGKEHDGRALTVNEAKPREDRPRGGGGGGGGGRGGYGGGGGGGGAAVAEAVAAVLAAADIEFRSSAAHRELCARFDVLKSIAAGREEPVNRCPVDRFRLPAGDAMPTSQVKNAVVATREVDCSGFESDRVRGNGCAPRIHG